MSYKKKLCVYMSFKIKRHIYTSVISWCIELCVWHRSVNCAAGAISKRCNCISMILCAILRYCQTTRSWDDVYHPPSPCDLHRQIHWSTLCAWYVQHSQEFQTLVAPVQYSQSHWWWHLRMLFQSSKLKARTSLFTETWQKRRSSFELWAFENVTPSGIGRTCVLRRLGFLNLGFIEQMSCITLPATLFASQNSGLSTNLKTLRSTL